LEFALIDEIAAAMRLVPMTGSKIPLIWGDSLAGA
jgi:hypothetical protein